MWFSSRSFLYTLTQQLLLKKKSFELLQIWLQYHFWFWFWWKWIIWILVLSRSRPIKHINCMTSIWSTWKQSRDSVPYVNNDVLKNVISKSQDSHISYLDLKPLVISFDQVAKNLRDKWWTIPCKFETIINYNLIQKEAWHLTPDIRLTHAHLHLPLAMQMKRGFSRLENPRRMESKLHKKATFWKLLIIYYQKWIKLTRTTNGQRNGIWPTLAILNSKLSTSICENSRRRKFQLYHGFEIANERLLSKNWPLVNTQKENKVDTV